MFLYYLSGYHVVNDKGEISNTMASVNIQVEEITNDDLKEIQLFYYKKE